MGTIDVLAIAALNLSKQRVFSIACAGYFFVPLLGLLLSYLLSNTLGPAAIPNIFLAVLGAATYALFRSSPQKMSEIIKYSSPAVLFFFSWSLLLSGGFRSPHLMFFSALVVVNGFLLGRKAALLTTIYTLLFTLIGTWFAQQQLMPLQRTELWVLSAETCLYFLFTAWIVMAFEGERQTTEQSLRQALNDSESLAIVHSEIQRMGKIGGWEMDIKTSATRWTDETYRIHAVPIGSPTHKVMGLDFYAEHERPRIARMVQDCINGEPFRDTFEFIDALKKTKWVEVMGHPIYDNKGALSHIRGTFQDVTEQLKALKELDQLVQNTPGMVYKFKLEPSGQMYFPFVSPKAFEIYEVTESEFAKNPAIMLEMADPDHRDGLRAAIQESAQNLSLFSWEGRIRSGSGRIKWVQARSVPKKEADGSIVWDGIVVDVTERKELQESLELERMKSMHASKLATLGEMAAGMAHEINNPLAIIAGSTQLLAKNIHQPERLATRIETIQKSVDRITRIVTGLRKFSRSAVKSIRKTEALQTILQESLIITDAKAKRHNTLIKVAEVQPLYVSCDAVEIEQVLVNLINNGIDAIKANREPWIEVKIFQDLNQAVVQVIDSGPGISHDLEAKLFQPFFTTKAVGEGTGLGLSISKGILDQHHATIAINRTFSNTCFEIRFPLAADVQHDQSFSADSR
jgi:signal transduction histidine kinase